NLDIAEGGVNDLLANSLSIKDTKPLVKTKSSLLYKIIVYVPKDYLSDVKQALYNAGAGHIGNYSNCSFETVGRSEEHTSELQSRFDLVCRLLLEKKKKQPWRRHASAE